MCELNSPASRIGGSECDVLSVRRAMAGDLKICEEVALAANLQRPAEEHEWKLGRQRGPGAPYPPSRGRNKPPRNGTVTDDTHFITRYCCLESSVAARRACITSHQTLPLTSSRLWMWGAGSLCKFTTRRGNSPPSCGSVWIAKAAYWQTFCYGSEAASLCERGSCHQCQKVSPWPFKAKKEKFIIKQLH